MRLSSDQQRKHQRLQEDFKFFAKHAPLTILPKDGKARPLVLNRAQEYAHQMAESQLANTGRVRALVVKSRQQGISTYIEARFYQRTSRAKGINAFVMAHMDQATQNIFEMVKRYHEGIHPSMRPATSHSNDRELVFAGLDSRYGVATAGSAAAGRSRTNRLFHGSEVAYWANTMDIRKGALQTVPDMNGTEIWLESTANGMGNMFHEMAMKALRGDGDYILIFIPWFWMPEYARPLPADFRLSDEEEEYRLLFDLSLEQMVWRRAKISEIGSEHEFKREYPATVQEAFETSGEGLFKPNDILRARQSEITDKLAPLIMGVDGARDGDRTVITFRRGREIPKQYVWDPAKGEKMDQMRLVGIVAQLIEKHQPAAVFIDVAEGHGAVDRLHELGFSDLVQAVHFGEGAIKSQVYMNKRAEMYGEFEEWLKGDVSIPDEDELHTDLSVIPLFKHNSSSRKVLPPKASIKEEFGFSPDLADSAVLTFAYPVRPHANRAVQSQKKQSSLKTMRRIRKES